MTPTDQKIYVQRSRGTEGPFLRDELIGLVANGQFAPFEEAFLDGGNDVSTVGEILGTGDSIAQAARMWQGTGSSRSSGTLFQPANIRPCPQCSGELVLQGNAPDKGTGIIVIVLGILLAPICVGLILIFWGASLMGNQKYYWHCRGCGRTYPA